MRKIPLLTKDQIEVRVAEVKQTNNSAYVSLLLYKTARTDMEMLDTVFGEMNWQTDYKVVDGKMYCGVAVWDKEKSAWIWKWNVGSESNMEAEKGEASDAFKRAGFLWGVGTELYSAPKNVRVWGDKCNITGGGNNGKPKCYDTFKVSDIKYDDAGNITELEIFNATKKCVAYKFSANGNACNVTSANAQNSGSVYTPVNPNVNPKFAQNNTSANGANFSANGGANGANFGANSGANVSANGAAATNAAVCADCGTSVSPAVANFSMSRYRKCLCMNCQKKHSAA